MQLMRLRLLVFLLPAALIAATLLVSASSFVSALETSLTPVEMTVINVQRYESDCDVLSREISEISRSATNCDADLQCLGSPILCPITMDAEKELEYQGLRVEFGRRCSPSIGPKDDLRNGSDMEPATCGSRFDWSASDTSDESTEPVTFVF